MSDTTDDRDDPTDHTDRTGRDGRNEEVRGEDSETPGAFVDDEAADDVPEPNEPA